MKRARIAVGAVALSVLLVTLVPVVSSAAIRTSDLDRDLLLRFDLEGRYADGDTIRDRSGSGNDGVYVGSSPNGTGEPSNGLRFSRNSGHIRVPLDEAELEGDFTVTANVRNGYIGYYAGIVTTEKWRLVAPYGRYEFLVEDRGPKYGEAAPGERRHLAAVYGDGIARLYVDGTLVGSTRVTPDIEAESVLVGQRPGGYPFEGRISEVRVYQRALTEPEVRGVAAGRHRVRPLLYSDAVRTVTPICVFLLSLGAAGLEVRLRSR